MATKKQQAEARAPEKYQTELRDPSTLTPHPQNYRAHPEEQIADIARNVRDLGMYRPVVVTPDGSILAGHGVTLACISLGMETIPVHVFEGTPAEERRLMVADNSLSRGAEDSEETLAALLGEIAESYGDLRGTGWSEDALAELVAEIEDVEHEEAVADKFQREGEWGSDLEWGGNQERAAGAVSDDLCYRIRVPQSPARTDIMALLTQAGELGANVKREE